MAAKIYFNSTITRWKNACIHSRWITKYLAILSHVSDSVLGQGNTLDYHQLSLYTSRYRCEFILVIHKRTVKLN